ncbi:MAG: hypothetical protein KAI62_01035 [Actinomycetia bacterium]|nr:hypothetical protein [Actinomycetes bacterium]
MKILKIEHCHNCKFYQYHRDEITMRIKRFKCYNPDNKRKNGNYRIINRRLAFSGKIPKWCRLEDWPKKECIKRVFGEWG